MMLFSLFAAGLLAQLCAAQQSGWQPGQVNATMCYWDSPRAAVVRDTLYIDGGALWWTPGMNDGTYGPPTSDDNPLGIVYQLNFSTIFNTSAQTNISNVFTTQSKAPANGAANNIAPNFYDGVMIANDFEWFTYGGLLSDTAEYTIPGPNFAAAYDVYASGPPKQFHAGYTIIELPNTASNNVTRYVTNGAGVSIPSENLGYYMGGLRSSSWGPIYYKAGNESDNADVLSTTMIELDLAVQTQETWTNLTLPDTVPGRINAELVWVPVSERGVLIAIGGVVDAEFVEFSETLNATQTANTNSKSPKLLSTVSVYDISKGVWYNQPTSGTQPPILTQGCTVVASSEDGSSHNIYWYGGWSGIDQTQPFSDDIWVLSIPSFVWVKVYSGTASHARAGHRCIKPYPDQMFVIGGYAPATGTQPTCLSGNIIQIFNLSSTTWITDYNPTIWSKYSVPSQIISVIGGTGTGSATKNTPSPSGFSNSSLATIFSSAYNTSKITTYYPYPAATSPSTPSNSSSPTPVPKPSSSSGTPSYLGPVLGVVLGLFFLTLLIVAFLIWRRRYLFRATTRNGQSENGTLDNRRWVTNWLRATPVDVKAPTITTDETYAEGLAQEREEENAATAFNSPGSENGQGQIRGGLQPVNEMGGQEVYEMMDTSQVPELHSHSVSATGLHPMSLHSHPSSPGHPPLNRGVGLAHSSSARSAASDSSALSRFTNELEGSPHQSPSPRPGMSVSPVMWEGGITAGHARGASDGSVSTVGGSKPGDVKARAEAEAEGGGVGMQGVPPVVPDPPRRSTAVSPLTPGNGGVIEEEGGDYLTSKEEEKEDEDGKLSPGTSTLKGDKRRSNFSEELGEK